MFSLMNFDNVVFSGKLAGMTTIFMPNDGSSYTPTNMYLPKWNRNIPARTQDVLYEVLRLYKGTYVGFESFVAETAQGYLAELQDGNNTECAMVTRKKDGSYYIKAGIIDSNDIIRSFSLNAQSKKLIVLALMPEFLKDEETKKIYDTMSDFLEWDVDAEDWIYNDHISDFAILLNQFSTNVEMRLSNMEKGIVIDTDRISNLRLSDLNVDISTIYVGVAKRFISATVSPAMAPSHNNVGFEGSFKYSNRTFSPVESNLIAKLPEKYVMPDFVPEICNYFKESSNFPAPMRVAYLIGPAGTGKTEAANAIFSGLGLPGDHYTCNPSTEIFDFIGQVFPNCNSDEEISFEDIRKQLNLPSTEDVVNNPVDSYEKVYGYKPTTFPNEGKIIVDMIDKVMKYMAQSGKNNNKNFTYVESGLIRAARMGYGFEIQEIGCVLRPGVAVGLNALLETGGNAFITLPTGETIKKHPECTFVFTSNDEYEGCCNLNQSVLDRMGLVYRIENPPKEAMKERIKTRLGFTDEKILERMIEVIFDISKASKEKGIEDGVCGYRALENWAMAALIQAKGGVITDAICYKTAINTVMNKTSQKKEYVEELMTCLTYQFAAPNLV